MQVRICLLTYLPLTSAGIQNCTTQLLPPVCTFSLGKSALEVGPMPRRLPQRR